MTYMLARTITSRLQKASKHILLLGPRQVGKSTLVRSLNPDKVINLADEELFLSYSKDPGRLKREIQTIQHPSLIVLDEVQRLPPLLNTVQALLDENSPHRFIFTGSSARKLKRKGVNLLPGRVLLEYLDPLSIWELGELFDLEKALQRGTLPEVYLDDQLGPEILSSYTNIYLREEIQTEAAAKNVGAYARFLDVAAEASGDWINYSKLASDSEIPKETIRRFFQILEETLIAFRIPAYRPKQIKRRVSQRDRFVFFDTGVRNAVLGIHHPLSISEKGNVFEQWVLLQCLYFIHANKKEWKLSSYRTDGGAEVDLVLDTGEKMIGIECKYGKNVSESQMRGLRSLEEIAHRPLEKYVVYQGESEQSFSKGELAIPFRKFFFEILPTL
jgi:predicted AAA+ superfamily ATPase